MALRADLDRQPARSGGTARVAAQPAGDRGNDGRAPERHGILAEEEHLSGSGSGHFHGVGPSRTSTPRPNADRSTRTTPGTRAIAAATVSVSAGAQRTFT